MDVKTYKRIISTIENFDGQLNDSFSVLRTTFPGLSPDTLYSIFSHFHQRRMKVLYHKTPAMKNKLWKQFKEELGREAPGIILRMSHVTKICPCLVARLILEKYLEEYQGEVEFSVAELLRDTSLIVDMELAYEIFLCTIYDNLYSPYSEASKQSLGQQYEVLLHKQVAELNLAFRNEEHLRLNGYDKTPDVKLDVPIAIDGVVINWIESKALFGDEKAHNEYIKLQYLSYWNRFGPGLIIYWFGYLKTIIQPQDKRFIIKDHLPKNFVRMAANTDL